MLKVRYGLSGDCRRFPLPVSPPLSFPALLSCVSSLFSLRVGRMELQWRDEEGDMVTVASEAEWQRLQRDARDRQQRVLQLSVVGDGATLSTQQLQQPQEQVADKQPANQRGGVDEAAASSWQQGVHSILAQHSLPLSSVAQPADEHTGLGSQREEKDTIIQPQCAYQQPHQLALTSPLSAAASSALSSDEDSPVLIDGANLPSASDSHVASALWKRHKYKAQQSMIRRRSSSQSSALAHSRAALPTAAPLPLKLSLINARSTSASKRDRGAQQLTATMPLSASLPTSPLSRSPPASQPSHSPMQNALSQHLERARMQLKHLMPASLASSSAPTPLSAHAASKLRVLMASEQERTERIRICAAYDLLASFIAMDGDREEAELVSRDELLSRCIALFVYNEQYLSDKKRRNDELAAQLGRVESNRREEQELEAEKRRQLLNEAQKFGLRSLSSSVPISASCSPALVTIMALNHQHLGSRVVTDVPATLECFAAVLADLTAQVQREENREATLKQWQQRGEQAEEQEAKGDLSRPPAGSQSAATSDAELLASLSRLPAPLRDSVRALLSDSLAYAATAVEANAGLPFASVASHSFVATLHAFRTDLQDIVSDERLHPQQQQSAQKQADEVKQQSSSLYPPPYQPQQIRADELSPAQQPQQAALDVCRDDVMLSDRKIMRAVAKAIKKEQRDARKEMKARRKAGRQKSDVSSALQQPVDSEERELHELLSQTNNSRQQQPMVLGGSEAQASSAASIDGDGWQLYPQSFASAAQTVDSSSPFDFQPFPYTLTSKQQQQQLQQALASRADQQLAALFSSPPAIDVGGSAAVASPQSELPSDAAHFPSLPFAASPGVAPNSSLPPPSPSTASAPQPSFASVVSSHAPHPAAAAAASAVPSHRVSSLLASLHVMGFTDDSLNTWLLQRNGYDLNQTVEWLIVQAEVGLD